MPETASLELETAEYKNANRGHRACLPKCQMKSKGQRIREMKASAYHAPDLQYSRGEAHGGNRRSGPTKFESRKSRREISGVMRHNETPSRGSLAPPSAIEGV